MKVKDVDALREQISEDPREAFTKHQVWLFASIHNKTVPTIEAIPKADVVAMLTEIQDELKHTSLSGVWKPNYKEGFNDSVAISVKKIQCRINQLKEDKDGNNTTDV